MSTVKTKITADQKEEKGEAEDVVVIGAVGVAGQLEVALAVGVKAGERAEVAPALPATLSVPLRIKWQRTTLKGDTKGVEEGGGVHAAEETVGMNTIGMTILAAGTHNSRYLVL